VRKLQLLESTKARFRQSGKGSKPPAPAAAPGEAPAVTLPEVRVPAVDVPAVAWATSADVPSTVAWRAPVLRPHFFGMPAVRTVHTAAAAAAAAPLPPPEAQLLQHTRQLRVDAALQLYQQLRRDGCVRPREPAGHQATTPLT